MRLDRGGRAAGRRRRAARPPRPRLPRRRPRRDGRRAGRSRAAGPDPPRGANRSSIASMGAAVVRIRRGGERGPRGAVQAARAGRGPPGRPRGGAEDRGGPGRRAGAGARADVRASAPRACWAGIAASSARRAIEMNIHRRGRRGAVLMVMLVCLALALAIGGALLRSGLARRGQAKTEERRLAGGLAGGIGPGTRLGQAGGGRRLCRRDLDHPRGRPRRPGRRRGDDRRRGGRGPPAPQGRPRPRRLPARRPRDAPGHPESRRSTCPPNRAETDDDPPSSRTAIAARASR